MGIKSRFGILLGGVFLVLLTVISVASYLLSIQNARTEAQRKAEIIFRYQLASLDYFRNTQIPLATELVESDRFYPELMSSFAASRLIHENFKRDMPLFTIKYACLNPILKSNQADQQENKIIEAFRNDHSLERQQGLLKKGGKTFFYMANPVPVEKACLRCHGNPVDAPKDQVAIYGSEHGYHWKPGDIIASFVVYVPFEQVLSEAQSNAFKLFSIGAVLLLLSMLAIGFVFNSNVVKPVVWLSKRAEEISLGDGLEEKIAYHRDDEIGALAKAINRLRISIVKMQKML